MKRHYIFMLLLLVCLFSTGCGFYEYGTYRQKDMPESASQDVKASGQMVLMVYMVGSDMESENGFASMDIEEMLNCGFDESGLTVLVCTGGASYWWNEEISETECEVYELHPYEPLDKVCTMEHDNMADPATLTEFMDYAYENYSANYYSMIFWNHGGGAVLGYGEDENHEYDTLSLNELDKAFADSKLVADEKKLEWVGFDACLMGMLEVADAFVPYADYMIASEEVENGLGWDYSFLDNLSNGEGFDGETAGKVIINAYSAYYDSFEDYCPEYILSCMDLSRCDKVVEALSKFVDAAYDELQEGNYSVLAKKRDGVKAFGKISETECYDTIDLKDFSNHFANMFPEESEELEKAVDEMVTYSSTNIADANGIAVYFPYSNKEYASEWVKEYSGLGFAEGYTGFIRSFTENLFGKPMTDWDMAKYVPAVEEAQEGLYVNLNKEQVDNFAYAKLSVWEAVEDWPGSYVLWLNSSETTLSEDGRLSSIMEQKRFVLGDSSGHKSDCTAIEIERSENHAVYEIQMMGQYYDEKTDKISVEWLIIHVKVDEEHPQGVILGIYNRVRKEEENARLPEKVSLKLKQGTQLNPIAFIRNIAFDENGNIKPFEEWESRSGMFDGFALDGELTVSTMDIDESADKCYVFFISDTQRNVYETNCAK